MRILSAADIDAAFDPDETEAVLREGFVRYSRGDVQLAAVGHLAFADPVGETHIKSGAIAGGAHFVVKVATNFPANAARGASPNNGFMALVSAETGAPAALLLDEGRLTDLRTALAGAIAASVIAPEAKRVGIVGAGVQAELQARYVARRLGVHDLTLWSRRREAAAALAAKLNGEGLNASVADSIGELCRVCHLIVTTTASTEPLISSAMIQPGARIVAVGADAPGKRELDPDILRRARMVIVDARAQCIDHGETGWAVRAGMIAADSLMELGEAIERQPRFADDDIVVADLTGLAVQDLQIATAILKRATNPSLPREG